MKDAIKFLAGIADGKINQALGFIRINNGVAQAGNSAAFVQMECDIDLDVTIKADRALAAMSAIKGDPKFKKNEKSVTISGGGVRVVAPIIPNDDFPQVEPSGEKVAIDGDIIPTIQVAKQFAAPDDVRAIFTGVYVGEYIRATDGKHGVRLDGVKGIDAILPVKAVDLLVKIGEEPTEASNGFGSVTFHYPWGWVRCNTIDGKFPGEQMDKGLETDASFVEADKLKSAVDTCKSIVANNGVIEIAADKVTSEDAVSVDIETGLPDSSFNCGLLAKALSVADAIAINPTDRSPAVFKGDNGLIGFVMPTIQ